MKKTLITAFVVSFAIAFSVSAGVPANVRTTLERAVANEYEAAERYDAFAAKAMEEGYPGAANLFRAAARAERVHAKRFEQAMEERGLQVPPAATSRSVPVSSTADNLRAASSAEVSERDTFYRQAIDAAKSAGDAALVKVFDQTRDTEVEHVNLLVAATRQLDSLKQPKTFYVCDECGYTSDIELPLCILCRVRHSPHEVN